MKMNEPVACDNAELAWAFPSVDPGAQPLGGRILVQLRRTHKKATSAGIILVEETKETEKWNNMVAVVVALGPLAYKNRDTMEYWPEGTWIQVGDYIRVPKWGGDRWEVKVPGDDDYEDPALFMILNDHEVIAKLTGDPMAMRAFL
jgi:co-chaperonin GroES (HSP10)|tara:strand:+ start:17468 stop:17905 length:438 start_codon:yes stop_codon:yes gene_type:complete